jgi:endonuclease-3
MRRTEKAVKIQKILDELYPKPSIPLRHKDPYTLLIAVILSAQCTDKRVNQVAPKLFERASTPAQMVELPISELEQIIRPCGLSPSKSKNIHQLSELLLAEHGGEVPNTFKDLEALPGVGHKTASVVMAQAFGKPAFPVDTHIHRLAKRWSLTRGNSVSQTERDLKKCFPKSDWGRVHLQIIYFGREHCPARNHDLDACPICSWAATKKRKREERRKRRQRRGGPRRRSSK